MSNNAFEVHDQDAFLVKMHPVLIGSFVYRGFSLPEAEDLTQETLARVCQHWDTVTTARSPEAWVHRTARNLANSWLRRLRVARRHVHGESDTTASEGDQATWLTVRAALDHLSARQREAVVLRYFADLSVDDTATAMGCAPGTVRALTSQAIARLRDHLTLNDPSERP